MTQKNYNELKPKAERVQRGLKGEYSKYLNNTQRNEAKRARKK